MKPLDSEVGGNLWHGMFCTPLEVRNIRTAHDGMVARNIIWDLLTLSPDDLHEVCDHANGAAVDEALRGESR